MDSSIGAVDDSTAKHLPECECYGRNHGECALCICDRLRACEERVKEHTLKAMAPFLITKKDELVRINYQSGYRTALLDARERIMRLPYEIDEEILVDRDEVIGWIDALREEQK